MKNIFKHWKIQQRIDEVASNSGIKTILVMKSHPKEMEVVLSGGKKGKEIYKPNTRGKKSTHPDGKYPLYCEIVVNTKRMVEVQKASRYEEWKNNDDWVNYGLGTYIGLPVKHHGKVVGTVCALNDRTFDFRKKEYHVLNNLMQIKDEIEDEIED